MKTSLGVNDFEAPVKKVLHTERNSYYLLESNCMLVYEPKSDVLKYKVTTRTCNCPAGAYGKTCVHRKTLLEMLT